MAAAVAILLAVLKSHDDGKRTAPGSGGDSKTATEIEFSLGRILGLNEKPDISAIIAENPQMEWVIDKLRERYGKKLADKGVQVKLLGGLIRHLRKKYPYDWKERVKTIVRAEFPEYSVELIEKLDKLAEYNNFISDNRDELRAAGPEERKKKLQGKRRELFGNEYEEIWDKEISQEKISDTLKNLDGRRDLSLNDKMIEYNNAVKSLHPESADKSSGMTDDDIMVRSYDLANKFLEMESVQSDLGSMEPQERSAFLKKLRKSMGLADDVVKKMEEVDRLRDELWGNGVKYNNERNAIIANYEGEERTRKIDDARKKFLGKNADLIKYEEVTFKFYRFQYPRRWGRD